MSAIDISKLTAKLGDYCQEHRDELISEVLIDQSFESKFEIMDDVTDEVPLPSLGITDLIKPANPLTFEPTANALKFDARVLKVRGIKFDLQLVPQVLEKTWLGKLKSSKDPMDLPFEAFIMSYIAQKAKENLHLKAIFKGVYNAAGSTPESTMSGFLKLITDLTTGVGAPVTPVVTGIISAGNVIDSLEKVYDGLGEAYKSAPSQMFIAPQIYDWYNRAYRSAFGANSNYISFDRASLDGTNCTLVREPGLAGSQRIICSPKENFVLGVNTISGYNIDIQKENRTIKVLGDFKAGVELKEIHSRALSVNDQA